MVWKCAKSDLRGSKTQKRPPYRVRCHVQSLHPPPLSIFLNEALQVTDEDTWSQLAHVIVQGVPADGMIDKGVDITIMGLDLFTKVDAAARLHKKTFQKWDKVPRTYDQRMSHLEGCIDMDLSFADKIMSLRTTVCIKWMLVASCSYHKRSVDS